jgi:hypothetical protein
MKTAQQIKIGFTLVSILFAGIIIAVLSHGTAANEDQQMTLGAPSQVVTITAKRLSVAEKLHYDALAAVGLQSDTAGAQLAQPMQTVVISAKRLTNEQKIAMDAAHARQLQANTQYNTLLRKTV